jgi:hypothetical protein
LKPSDSFLGKNAALVSTSKTPFLLTAQKKASLRDNKFVIFFQSAGDASKGKRAFDVRARPFLMRTATRNAVLPCGRREDVYHFRDSPRLIGSIVFAFCACRQSTGPGRTQQKSEVFSNHLQTYASFSVNDFSVFGAFRDAHCQTCLAPA